jgi:hypothetical protein
VRCVVQRPGALYGGSPPPAEPAHGEVGTARPERWGRRGPERWGRSGGWKPPGIVPAEPWLAVDDERRHLSL